MTIRCLFAVALLTTPYATFAASGCESLSPVPIVERVLWPQVFEAMTNQSNCTQNCHLGMTAAAQMELGDMNVAVYFLVNQPSSQNPQQLRVDPGNAAASLFFQKVNCASPDVGGRMPPGGHVPLELQALIFDWIEQGAYGESIEDPIVRDFIFKNGVERLHR